MSCVHSNQHLYRSWGGMVKSRARQTGLTLLELMIALSLGLLLVVGIGTIYVGSNQTYRVQEQNARIQESGRYALEVIGRSVRQVGYWNMPLGVTSTDTGFRGIPINGLNGVCTPTGLPVSDVLTGQFDGVAGENDCQGGVIAAGEIVQQTFFIEMDTSVTPNVPALRCDAVRQLLPLPPTLPTLTPPTACPTASGPGTGDELLRNVEDLQFLYGVDTDGNQSANLYTATPANWNQVVSVRACVLIRSELPAITTVAQTYRNCAGALGTATGAAALTTAAASDNRRLHRAFVATFNLRNRVTNLP